MLNGLMFYKMFSSQLNLHKYCGKVLSHHRFLYMPLSRNQTFFVIFSSVGFLKLFLWTSAAST